MACPRTLLLTSTPFPRWRSRPLKKAGLSPNDLDLLEINEAFAAVALHSTKMFFNGNGRRGKGQRERGSGRARSPDRRHRCGLTVSLLHELKRRGGGLGAAALCGGGGQGDAVIFKV